MLHPFDLEVRTVRLECLQRENLVYRQVSPSRSTDDFRIPIHPILRCSPGSQLHLGASLGYGSFKIILIGAFEEYSMKFTYLNASRAL